MKPTISNDEQMQDFLETVHYQENGNEFVEQKLSDEEDEDD